MTFPTMPAALASALAARGYDTPTAVQLAVLDAAAAGRDLLVSAQTGSGKTVAFGLALGEGLIGDAERLPPPAAPLALIIAPTRELALQVCRELSWLYESTGARVITCVGGMDPRAEARQLEAGAHIVVGTPGRLRDHLERRRLELAGLRAVVLDEADEMLDLGFREDLEFILDATPPERRSLLFSATVPREIEALARRFQRDALRIETGRRNEQHADIEYIAHRVVPHDVENTVVNVLRFHEARAALVFCATREAVNRLSARLTERGFSAVALSGELTQHERVRALQALRDGRARVLVATDVAARGLDLPDLALVIHAELPNDGETLLHRSGRTGRAGRKGLCVLVVPFNRRRRAEAVLGAARLSVSWRPAPTPDEIRARDQERFIADPGFTTPATDEEAQLARALQASRTPDEIALALVRLHGAQLPAPEVLAVDTGPPPRREWQQRDARGRDRGERAPKPWQRDDARRDRGAAADANDTRHGVEADTPRQDTRPPRPRRDDTRPMTWFRINIGRNRNADPRWLLPLICNAGNVTKTEIGAIRIEERETRFQILAEAADQFEVHARTLKEKQGHIVRASADDASGAVAVARPAEASTPLAGEHASPERRFERKPAGKHDAGRDRDGKHHAGKSWERGDKDGKGRHKAPKAPWQERGKRDASFGGGRPAKPWQGKKHGAPGQENTTRDRPEPTARPASKYAKKKKHRPAAPADR